MIMMAKCMWGQMWPKFPDIHLIVEGNPGKKLNQETDPTEI